MYSKTETVDREVQQGDFVMADVQGQLAEPREGEEQPDLSRDGFPVFVRDEDREDEWPFPGFTQRLLGLKAGEETDLTHEFSPDVSDESLRGKTGKFAVTVKAVRAVTLPELNDEFAKIAGVESLDELRRRVRENLERQSREAYDDKYFVELFDLIKQGATIKYPPQVLDHEAEHVREELERRLADQRMDLETYLKVRSTEMETFLAEEVQPAAKRRLERSLLIDEIARQEKIELSEQELTDAFNQYWSALSATDEQFQKMTKGGTRGSRDMVNAVALDAANRSIVSRVLDHLKAMAIGQAEASASPGVVESVSSTEPAPEAAVQATDASVMMTDAPKGEEPGLGASSDEAEAQS
jgi:trigger factor